MGNLKLRIAVALELGCHVMTDRDESKPAFCLCDDRAHSQRSGIPVMHYLKPYELDHHAALDALEEFCGDTHGYMIHRFPGPPTLFEVFICDDDWKIISSGRANEKAIAICEAIAKAAQKSEKEARE